MKNRFMFIRNLIVCLLLLFNIEAFTHPTVEPCTHILPFLKPICLRMNKVWTEGDNHIYFSGYAWHNRFTYSRDKIHSFNEAAWGGGVGKGLFDEKGNWHALGFIGFLDSHSQLEPVLGYTYLKVANLDNNFKFGLGFTAMITARSDTNHFIPFPGALPWATLFFKKFAVSATYIPGFNNNGNVMYVLGQYTF
jgi:palmitoyl transferase